MSHPWDWDFLIHRHLSGEELTEEQRTALNERLRKFPRLRKRLAEMAFEQANLRDALTVSEAVPIVIVPEPAAAPLLKPAPDRVAPKPRLWILPVAAAAACLIGIVAVVLWSAGRFDAPFKVVAGEVKIDGPRVSVAGPSPALFRMSDGSEAELAPSSAAVFHGRKGEARQVVELSQGSGKFKVAKAPDSFRVDTSVGTVAVLGTEFTVELRKQKKGPPALAVSVASGRVRVEAAGQRKELGPGESRVFGVEPPPEKKDPPVEKKEPRAVFNGTVRGRVVGKGDAHILLAVDAVVSTRKESPTEPAAGLPGRTLRITPIKRKEFDLGFDKVQFLFLRKVRMGQELSLDVRQIKGDDFSVGALTEEQYEWAQVREDRSDRKKPRDPEKSPDRGDKKED